MDTGQLVMLRNKTKGKLCKRPIVTNWSLLNLAWSEGQEGRLGGGRLEDPRSQGGCLTGPRHQGRRVGGPIGSMLAFDRSSDDLQGSKGELEGPGMSRGEVEGSKGLLGDPMMGSTGRLDWSSDDLSAYSPIHIYVI